MNTRILKAKDRPTILVRPLRNGDIDTVLTVFHRLSDQSRRRRFNGAKPRLTEDELWALARVDATHHALVAYVEGDPDPVAVSRLVRDGQAAEIAFEVANDYQQHGIGTALTEELLADASAAGITEITALVTADNPAALSLLRRALRVLDISLQGPELSIRAAIPRRSRGRAPSLLRLPWDSSLDWTDET